MSIPRVKLSWALKPVVCLYFLIGEPGRKADPVIVLNYITNVAQSFNTFGWVMRCIIRSTATDFDRRLVGMVF